MKKFTLLTTIFLLSFISHAQIITESVTFDNYVSASDNDLSNNFRFGGAAPAGFISQSTTGGITGGALIPPSSVSWGNDVIQYCSTFRNTRDSLIEASLSFYYNTSLINANANERAIAIWFRGNTINHDVAFYLNRNLTLSITTYSYAQNTPVNLINGHWYKLVAQYKSIGGTFNDEVFAKAEIFDLGTTGINPPTAIGDHTATIFDQDLVSSLNFIVDLTGTTWGGSEYLDNFVFTGEKDGTLCTATGIADMRNAVEDMIAYPVPASDEIFFRLPDEMTGKPVTIEVFNAFGKKLRSYSFTGQTEVSLSLSDFKIGIYYCALQSEAFTGRPKKIVLAR